MKYASGMAKAVLFASLVAAPVTAQAAGTLDKIKETGRITIGYREASIPFSYLDENQKPTGFAYEICLKIADAVKEHLQLDRLDVALTPVTSATRIPLIANGTVDLECGSTTNNLERQGRVPRGGVGRFPCSGGYRRSSGRVRMRTRPRRRRR